ncbi:MAG TPA: transglycosylase SLT domain-containing protein [Stellaceae bacterium]|nr:transglycosylase SLT domain-containing protein [Stellaceae bacterium]
MAVNPQQATVGGHALPPDVLQSIRSASSTTGVDFKFLVAQASLESGFQADVKSRRSSAAGLFQFTSQTWLEMMRDHGAKYGQADLAKEITTQANGRLSVSSKAVEKQILDLRKDVGLSAQMAAELTKTNSAQLEKALGRKPSAADLHLSMLLGATGAVRFLKAHQSDGTTAAAALLPAAARQNPTIFYDNGHTPKTVAAVYQRIARSIATPMHQVAALEHAGITHAAAAPPAPTDKAIPLRPGTGLIASAAPTPIDRKS